MSGDRRGNRSGGTTYTGRVKPVTCPKNGRSLCDKLGIATNDFMAGRCERTFKLLYNRFGDTNLRACQTVSGTMARF